VRWAQLLRVLAPKLSSSTKTSSNDRDFLMAGILLKVKVLCWLKPPAFHVHSPRMPSADFSLLANVVDIFCPFHSARYH
jgi:hypothetical protein